MGIGSIFRTGYQYGKRILKVTPDLIIGTGDNGSEAIGKVGLEAFKKYRAANNGMGRSLLKASKDGLKYLEGNAKATKLGTWARLKKYTKLGAQETWSALKDMGKNYKIGSDISKAGARAAEKGVVKTALKSVGGGLYSALKPLGECMPFLTSALMVLSEVPNIWTAVKEKGLWQGAKEAGKATAKLAGGAGAAAAGAAVGTAICPGIGTLLGSAVGWFAGEWLAGKVVGKSYTEEKQDKADNEAEFEQNMAYAEQAAAEADAAYAGVQSSQYNTAYGTNPFQANGLNTFNPLPYQYSTRSFVG